MKTDIRLEARELTAALREIANDYHRGTCDHAAFTRRNRAIWQIIERDQRLVNRVRLRLRQEPRTCPQCGGHVTHCPDGMVAVPTISVRPFRNEEPRDAWTPAPFDACDCCEWIERTAITPTLKG